MSQQNTLPNTALHLVKVEISDKEMRYLQWHMDNAERAAQMSHCVRLKVGAIVVKDGHTISSGWNGMPEGFNNVCEINPDLTNPLVRHAERNALERFMSRSESTDDADMFVTTAPCLDCAITINTRAKLKRVFFKDFYRSVDGVAYLVSHTSVEVFQFTGKELFLCTLTSNM